MTEDTNKLTWETDESGMTVLYDEDGRAVLGIGPGIVMIRSYRKEKESEQDQHEDDPSPKGKET